MSARIARKRAADPGFRQRMSNLYQSIGRAYLAGSVEQHSYNLAMQIFARMVSAGSDHIEVTMREVQQTLAMRGETLVCTALPIDDLTFEFYTHGAMQQCQQAFGLMIARSKEELDAGIKEFEETGVMPTNFTAWPYDQETDDWNYVSRDQKLHCKSIWDQGQEWKTVIQDYADSSSCKLLRLPKWIPRLEI